MSREIKFRAWDKKYRTMHYGDIRAALAYPNEDVVIEQFTGLGDNDSHEIYEGDICRYETEDGTGVKAKVVFRDGDEAESLFTGFGMEVIATFEREIDIDGQPIDGWRGCLERIGDIHQNPELLQ